MLPLELRISGTRSSRGRRRAWRSAPSSTLKLTSTRSGAPGTGVVSESTFFTYGRRWMRCFERSSAAFESQPPSSWRISRRSTSSLMRLEPPNVMFRTYTRLPGSTKNVSETSCVCSFGRRDRVHLRERVAIRAEPVLDQLLGGGDELAIERLPGREQQIPAQLRFGHDERAGELHVADLVDLAFIHVDRDEDVVLLGRDRHLRGFDRGSSRSRGPCRRSAAFPDRPAGIRASSGRPACTRRASSACAARSRRWISFSVNVSLPTTLIWRIFARLPSLMSILSFTRLPEVLLDLRRRCARRTCRG